jgi:hypothetical protein
MSVSNNSTVLNTVEALLSSSFLEHWNIGGVQQIPITFLPVCATILSFEGYVCVVMRGI